VVAGVVVGLGPGTAATAADVDPTPIDCAAQPWRVECEDAPGEEDQGGGGERECTHLGEPVPCNHPDYGWWLGSYTDPYGHAILVPGIGALHTHLPEGETVEGCWAQQNATQGVIPTRNPTWGPGPEPDPDGAWYTLHCLRGWPYSALLSGEIAEPPQMVIAVWLDSGAAPPDPETLARRAVATIGLRGPEILLSPPETGAVLFGMPVWLATAETEATWGPNASGEVCDQGLCVWVTARATHVDWDMGDGGGPVRCERDQNVPWQPGMDFLRPGSSCHHCYTEPSYHLPDGRYQVTATTSFRVDWSGGGQSGVFEGITGACGPAGTDPCRSTATVRVVELQLLTSR
jgi:hypothetical protein